MLMPSFTSTVLLVDLTGTGIWRGLKAFATTSPRRGLKLESNMVESRVSLRPFISWTKIALQKSAKKLGHVWSWFGKNPVNNKGEHNSIKINGHMPYEHHSGNSPAPSRLSGRSFLRWVLLQFIQMHTHAIFPKQKKDVRLAPTVFVPSTAIHPRDQQARFVGLKDMHCAQAHHGVITLHFGGLLKRCEKLIRRVSEVSLIGSLSWTSALLLVAILTPWETLCNESTIFEITVHLRRPASLSLLFLEQWVIISTLGATLNSFSRYLRAKWQSTNAKRNW